MTAKEYLRQIHQLDGRADDLMERAERSRAKLMRLTAAYGGVPGGGDGADWTDRLVSLIQREGAELDAQVDELYALKRQARAVIAAVPVAEYRRLLELRYIDYRTWEDIAERLNCDAKTVWRWHGRALQMVIVPKDAIECHAPGVV